MQAVASQTAEILPQVANQLHTLRRSVKIWLVADGLSRLLLTLIALVLLDLLVDWFLHMDIAQRGVSLCIMLCVLTWITYRKLVRPLVCSLGDDALCHRVEAQNKQLGQSLISAVQFSRMANIESLGISPTLVEATIQQGMRKSDEVDFGQILDKKKFHYNLLLTCLGLVGVMLVGTAIVRSDVGQIWFERNVLLGSAMWPQKTYLKVQGITDDGQLVFPRGDDKLLVVEATVQSQVVPHYVSIKFRSTGKIIQIAADPENNHLFQHTLKNVQEEFEFYVWGGDAETPWYKVMLTARPEIESLELELAPPLYTKEPSRKLTQGRRYYDLLRGSRLTISGTSSKNLSGANLLIGAERVARDVSGESKKQFSMTVDLNQSDRFTSYAFELFDESGLASKGGRRFRIRMKPDRRPTVSASLDGISSMIVSGATVRVNCKLKDDYGITSAELAYNWSLTAESSVSKPVRLPLSGIQESLDNQEKNIIHVYPFAVSKLELPVGAKLTFHVEAADNDNETQNKEVGKSEPFLLSVVTAQELRNDMLRREKEYRYEFERLLGEQEKLLDDCRAILANVRGKAEVPDAERQWLLRIQKRQSQIPRRCDAIANRFASLVKEVQNNRLELPGGPIQKRLRSKIVAPLRALATQDIPPAAGLLEDARRALTNIQRRDEILADSASQQQRIVHKMRRVLRFMVKAEGYQDAVNLLFLIQELQKKVFSETVKQAALQIGRFFGEESNGNGQEKNKNSVKDKKTGGVKKNKPATPKSKLKLNKSNSVDKTKILK